jgi:hypothetical protein
LLLLDLDNTLADRERAFLAWAQAKMREWARAILMPSPIWSSKTPTACVPATSSSRRSPHASACGARCWR